MKTNPGSIYLQQQCVLLRLASAHVSRGVPRGSCAQPEVTVLGLGASKPRISDAEAQAGLRGNRG